MKPSPGRIVLYRQPAYEAPHNGVREHPAIVTRVWSGEEAPVVNLTVFPDFDLPYYCSSVSHASKATDAERAWIWPPRTE